MGHLRVKGNDSEYKEDMRLKEQFINGIGGSEMITERK